jgi:hypothetical protein
MITTKQVFEANQVLTLEIAKTLKGKKIATTHPVYRANTAVVTEFVVGEIISEWDLAAKNIDAANFPQGNQQLYWASYMSEDRIEEAKNTLNLLAEDGTNNYIRCHINSGYFPQPTFTCSDADREVYYIIVEEKVIIRHLTKGYFQTPNNWIVREENAAKWATKFTIAEAEAIAPTLTSLDGTSLKKLELVRLRGPHSEFEFWNYELVKTITNA